MRRVIVEKMIVLGLEAIKKKQKEQIWLGLTLATLLVVLFGPGGVTTGSQATNSPGSYHKGGSDKTQSPIRKIDPKQLPEVKKNSQQDEVPLSHGEKTVYEDQPQPAVRLVNPNELPTVKKPAQEK